MANEDLHLTYRPSVLKDVIGQEAIVKSISSLIKNDNLPHSFLFHGPSGTGKTTVARIIASEIGCTAGNIMEFDAASFSGVDSIRDLTRGQQFVGMGNSRNKIYIIDECQALSKQAWQALLKPIEEPLDHIYFVLCTTELAKVPKTIQTRCHAYAFREASYDNLIDLLQDINEEEEFNLADELLQYITKQSQGSYRQAIVNLSACRDAEDKKEIGAILSTVVPTAGGIDLCRLLVSSNGNFKEAVKLIRDIMKGGSTQAESVRILIMNYMAAIVIKTPDSKNVLHILSIMEAFSVPYNASEKSAPLILSIAEVYFD